MTCVNYNLLKDGSLVNATTTVSGYLLLDSTAIAALYDGDFVTPAFTVSGTPQRVHLQQEFGEAFDVCFVRYYTNESTPSRISMSYSGVEGQSTPLVVYLESSGVYRADLNAGVNYFDLIHTVSGTVASVYELEVYGVENESLGFGRASNQIDYYTATHSTAHMVSAVPNVIPIFNDSQYDDVAKVSIAPTLTEVDDYLFIGVSDTGPFYGINDYGFSQPGTNPIALHDDTLCSNTIDPQWERRVPGQGHAMTPTPEGLYCELDYIANLAGTPTRSAVGIYSKESFSAQSFTAEVQIRILSIDNTGFNPAHRSFMFVLTNNFPINDVGYFDAWMTDRRRGSSVVGIALDTDYPSYPSVESMRHSLRWVDGSFDDDPSTSTSNATDNLFTEGYAGGSIFNPPGETDEVDGLSFEEIEDAVYAGQNFGDFTESSSWHTWKIVYDHKKKQMSAYVDNIHVGDRLMKIEPFGESCRLFIGESGNGGVKWVIRNFKISPNMVYRQYVVSSTPFGGVASATISGAGAPLLIDGSTSTCYIGPDPTSNSHVRIDFSEPSDVTHYRIKQRAPGTATVAYGKTYYPDIAVQSLVDFGGKLYQANLYKNDGSFQTRAPTMSGSYPTVASGISYIDLQFTEYDRTQQTNGALAIEEIEVYAEEVIEHTAPASADSRNVPWSKGRWNNLKQYGTSLGLAIKNKNSIEASFYPVPEHFLTNIDWGASSAVNGRQGGDEANEYHFGGALFSSPGETGAGDYRQWHSADQADNHIYVWRYFAEESRVRAVYWDSTTLYRSHVADRFKFQYLAENGDPNVESDWLNIPSITVVHPHTGGSFSADTNYKAYKNFLISNSSGGYYNNYYNVAVSGTGFTVSSTGSLVGVPTGLVVPAGYFDSTVAVIAQSPSTRNGLHGYIEFDVEYKTRGIRMVIHTAKESGATGPAGAVEPRFSLDRFYVVRMGGCASYTSPVFDTGTPQNTERLSASIRELPNTSSNIYVRSSGTPPEFVYDDTFEVWESMAYIGPPGTILFTSTTDRAVVRGNFVYYLLEASAWMYDLALDTWTALVGYPSSGDSTTTGSFGEDVGGEFAGDTEPTSSPLIPDNRVQDNCVVIGNILYVACRTNVTNRTPRFMKYDFDDVAAGWVPLKNNRPPESEYAFMVGYEPEGRIYFFNKSGVVSYYDLASELWIIEDAVMPTFGGERDTPGSALFEGKVYVFGGLVLGAGTVNCNVFDLSTKQFSTIASAPYPMQKVQAVVSPNERSIYVFPVGVGGNIAYTTTMKYSVDSDSWVVCESLMWFREIGFTQGPESTFLFYAGGYIYRAVYNYLSRTKVDRPLWSAGEFHDLRDPVWGGSAGTILPWVGIDYFGELMPQERYFQYKIELYSDDRVASPILEGVTIVTPMDVPIAASGTSNVYLKVGVSPEGTYEAWYSGEGIGPPASIKEDYSILYTKSFDGVSWGVATTVSGAWSINPANPGVSWYTTSSPWVIKESATSYMVWFTKADTDTSDITGAGTHIYYSLSSSPVVLMGEVQAIAEGVISQANEGATQPCVIKEGPTSYKIWYTGLDNTGVRRILSASSSNGVSWSAHAVSLSTGRSTWDATAAYRPCVLFEDSLYKMWYTGEDSAGVARILYTYSTDGSSWIDPRIVIDAASEGDLDFSGCVNPTIIRDAAQYICYYVGYNGSSRSVVQAVSPDGLEWFNFQLVVPPGGLMEYVDGDGAIDFFVVLNKDTVVPGSMVSGAQLKLYNSGAAL